MTARMYIVVQQNEVDTNFDIAIHPKVMIIHISGFFQSKIKMTFAFYTIYKDDCLTLDFFQRHCAWVFIWRRIFRIFVYERP